MIDPNLLAGQPGADAGDSQLPTSKTVEHDLSPSHNMW